MLIPERKSTFPHSSYQAFRPTYPQSLFTYLLSYHNSLPPDGPPTPPPHTTLLDLGCGPGTVTRPLSKYFTHTIGIDPSPGMVSQAIEHTPSSEYPNVTYVKSPAESLPFIADSSIDVAVAAQAAHWFNFKPFFKEMSRVLKKNGTLACWVYSDEVFVDYPRATKVLLEKFSYSCEKWGLFWGQPGRNILRGRLREIQPESNGEWHKVERWEYEPELSEFKVEQLPEPEEVPGERGEKNKILGKLVKQGECMMRKTMKLKEVEEYTRTWSCVHGWLEAHPEEKRRTKEHPEWGDTVDELLDEMARAENNWGCKEGEDWKEKAVSVEWGHGMVCMKRTGMGKE